MFAVGGLWGVLGTDLCNRIENGHRHFGGMVRGSRRRRNDTAFGRSRGTPRGYRVSRQRITAS